MKKLQEMYHEVWCAALVASSLWVASSADAQPATSPATHFWRVNGPVYETVVRSNVAYLGGAFTYLGPPGGNVALVDLATGDVRAQVPELQGQVNCILPDGQNGWFVGGQFKCGALSNLVHLLPNGTVDPGWKVNPNDAVWTLALGVGHLYVGGEFTKLDGVSRSYLVSLNPLTGETNNWAVKSQGTVRVMVLAGDTLFLGGSFTSMASQSRSRLAAVEATTGALKTWNPGLSGGGAIPKTMVVVDNLVYVGGDFRICGTKPRYAIAAIDTTTGVATDWNPNALQGAVSGVVNSLVINDGAAYVGGTFTAIGGRNRNNLAQIDLATGQADATWDPNPNSTIQSLIVAGGGLIAVGNFSTMVGENRDASAMLYMDLGDLDAWRVRTCSTDPSVVPVVRAVAEQNGVVALGGDFVSIGGVERKRLVAVDLSTGRPTAWKSDVDNEVYALALGEDRLYVGGLFGNLGGSNIARVGAVSLASGNALAWDPHCSTVSSHVVLALAVSDEGRVFVGGKFTSIGGQARSYLAELDPDSAEATDWNPAPQLTVRALCIAEDRLFVGGEFTTIAATNRPYLAAFDLTNLRIVPAFDPKANGIVRALVTRSSLLYAGGDFTQIGGQSRNRLGVVATDTGSEPAIWNPNIGLTGTLRVYSIATAGNTVYVGGNFASAGGELRKDLVGMGATSAAANAWNPSPNLEVYALAVTEDWLLVGGAFTSIGSTARPYFAVFSGQPSFIPGSLQFATDGSVSLQVTDGDGQGSSVDVQVGDSLTGPWGTLQTLPIAGASATVQDTQAAAKPARFYRLSRNP